MDSLDPAGYTAWCERARSGRGAFFDHEQDGILPVLKRLQGLFHRYADRHLTLDCPGFALEPAGGEIPLGHVDRVEVRGNRVHVLGWSTADRVTLSWEGGQDSRQPHIPREDVANALGLNRYTGFVLEAPLHAFPFTLQLHAHGAAQTPQPVATLTLAALRGARARLRRQFVSVLARLSPTILGYALHRDPGRRDQIKRGLGLEAVPQAGPMETALFTFVEGDTVSYPTDVPITVIMPVYNAFELTQAALERVATHTDLPWHAVVIEDCSTDPAVRPWLRDWAAAQNAAHPGRVTLLENETNRGFIGSVNRGFAAALERGDHVVLLNSDALVPAGWASRLIRPMIVHENVATVTPMSNDAEIFSAPVMCVRSVLAPGEADAVDRVAQSFHPEATLSVAPTGVGFCMAMHIDWLRKVPTLDPVFGRGYGEEVDWCQKVRALGARHLGLPGLYVEHRGGESFGSAEKIKLVLNNNQIVSHRYPTYDREVQSFIAADPLITPRVALAAALLAERAREAGVAVPIYLAHSLGGGADDYLEIRIKAALPETRGAVILRVGGPQRWQVEVITETGRVSGGTDDFDFVKTLLAPIGARRIVYSCGVGDPDPADLPDCLLALRRDAPGADGPADEVEVLFHDFFALSPSYCLLDTDGAYRGLPDGETEDEAHQFIRPDGSRIQLSGWRAAWGPLLEAADQVTVFSEDSRDHVLQVYPSVAENLRIQPHDLLTEMPVLPQPAPDARQVIGVLGNIGFQKGAQVVQDLARHLERGGAHPAGNGADGPAPDSADPARIGLVLIGNIDPAYGLPASAPVHGTYRIAELDQLAAKYGITCWLIPSIWPETFSYTTHEALATGLPVFAFHLGAQGTAVARAENGHLIHFDPDAPLAEIVLDTVQSVLIPGADPAETDAPAPAAEDAAEDGVAISR